MRLRHVLSGTAAVLLLSAPAAAQQSTGLMADLLRDVTALESKLMSLAKDIPADKQSWRPAAGVRSVGEVWLHVAADNYLLPAAIGVAPDPETGINATEYSTVTAYENRKMTREQAIAALEKSFAHLKKAMAETPESRLDSTVKFFGQDRTVRQVWVATTTHLHEHLGQAIAYARSNGVVPSWSRSGGN